MIKKIFSPILGLIFRVAYKNLDYKRYAQKDLVRCFINQKIFRNNNAPWPVHKSSKIICPENIVPGTWPPGYSINCYLDARNGIVFEENVRMGPGVSIISMNHDNLNYSKYLNAGPIKIGKNSWLAANCTLLPGIELGEHTIVAAGAIVTKSFTEENQIIAGNPAKVVKKLEAYKEKEEKEIDL